ncbi:MAG: thioredoxin family protein [Sphingobium sp.]|jgi:glutaredoxin|nr:thioredoxin family protein [Sphingobium sp.]MCP5398340.1 thioredoxin family protein [Sphingomonas sp.]
MKSNAIFYHAGCSVCASAEQALAGALDPARYDVEVVDFNDAPERIAEAEAAGVVSVPAYVIDGQPFHINFGASMAAVKGEE